LHDGELVGRIFMDDRQCSTAPAAGSECVHGAGIKAGSVSAWARGNLRHDFAALRIDDDHQVVTSGKEAMVLLVDGESTRSFAFFIGGGHGPARLYGHGFR